MDIHANNNNNNDNKLFNKEDHLQMGVQRAEALQRPQLRGAQARRVT